MGKQKESEIRKAIREMMQNNVMNRVIEGKSRGSQRHGQSRSLFLYLEVKNTKPKLRYLYDLSKPVWVGRDEERNHICIQDMEVSREQGRFWAERGKIYYANEPHAAGAVKIRRGIWSVELKRGQRFCLQTGDCLKIGIAKIKVRLFVGEQELFG